MSKLDDVYWAVRKKYDSEHFDISKDIDDRLSEVLENFRDLRERSLNISKAREELLKSVADLEIHLYVLKRQYAMDNDLIEVKNSRSQQIILDNNQESVSTDNDWENMDF